MSRRSRNRHVAMEPESDAGTDARQFNRTRAAIILTAQAAAFFVALLLFGWITQFGSALIRDPDELYHFHHALIYGERGLATGAFPWLTLSVISQYNADLWYGFHLLIVPFTKGNPIAGLKLATVIVTAASAAIVWIAVRLSGFRLSFLWPILFLFATGFGLSRFYMLRPGVLSMALTCLLLTALYTDRRRLALVVAAAFAFVHLTVVWLPVAVCIAVALSSRLLESRWRGRVIGWAFTGLALGAVLRPNPIGAMHLLYIQTIGLAIARASGALPYDVQEMTPLPVAAYHTIGLFTVLLAAATAMLLRTIARKGWRTGLRDQSSFILVTGLFTIAFGLGVVLSAMRCLDQFHGFGTLYLAAVATVMLHEKTSLSPITRGGARERMRMPFPLAAVAAAIIAIGFVATSAPNAFRGDPTEDLNPYKYHDAALWLRTNAPSNCIVFHARWFDFPLLFFWNDRDRYIGGMDPVFSYYDSPTRTYEYQQFRTDRTGGKILAFPTDRTGKSVNDALTKDFGASYVLVEPSEQPHLAAALAADPSATLAFGNDGQSIEIYSLASTVP